MAPSATKTPGQEAVRKGRATPRETNEAGQPILLTVILEKEKGIPIGRESSHRDSHWKRHEQEERLREEAGREK